MIDLPTINPDDLLGLADWVELTTSCEPTGSTSVFEVADVLYSSGLAGTAPSDNFIGEFEEEYDGTLSDKDAAERLAQDIWSELKRRSTAWGHAYPYSVDQDTVSLTGDSWRETPAYHMLLIIDVVRFYPSGPIAPDLRMTRLFEKIVQAAKGRLLGGRTSRFGWPIEFGWPTSIGERVAALASELGLSVSNMDEFLFTTDNDRGLDVVGLLAIDGTSDGTLAILTQCAAGQNWKAKTGEPSLEDWQDVLDWNMKLVKGFAVPWRLASPWDYRRVHRKFNGAVVFDRPRIIALAPDEALVSWVSDCIAEWCEPRLAAFPQLS